VVGSDNRRLMFEMAARSESLASEEALGLRRLFMSRPSDAPPELIVPESLHETETGPILASDHPLGVLLATICGKPLPALQVLNIAVSVISALDALHSSGFVHGRLNPARIWFNHADGTTRFSGIAFRDEDRRRLFETREMPLEPECWPYLSPEQVRTESPHVDRRSDLYAVGAIIYELIAGKPPFLPRTMLECSHVHIALPVPALAGTCCDRQPQIGRLVQKLLAKNPDERYQSSQGLLADVLAMRDEFVRSGVIPEFPLGRLDRAAPLPVPGELLGRSAESEKGLGWIHAMNAGHQRSPLLITGLPGSGKTVFFQQCLLPKILERGYLARCKFDQAHLERPGAGFIQIAEGICRDVLGGAGGGVVAWKERLLQTLGKNACFLTSHVPLLEKLLGIHESPAGFDPTEVKGRTIRAWSVFFKVCSSRERPLFLFFDDVQWIDRLSSDILSALLHDKENRGQGPFLVLAYRTEDTSHTAAFPEILTALPTGEEAPVELKMNDLDIEDVRQLLRSSFGQDVREVHRIAELAHARTGGNPFHLRQFFEKLKTDGNLTFSDGSWQWNLAAIESMNQAGSVVDLLCQRLSALPDASRRAIEIAGCFGNEFDTNTFQTAMRTASAETNEILRGLRHEGFLVSAGGSRFRFAHDRIQQAAVLLLAPEVTGDMHLAVARAMVSEYDGTAGALFSAAAYLLRPGLQPASDRERHAWIHLLTEAAVSARTTAAPLATISYSTCALSLLEPFGESAEFVDTSRELHLLMGEAQYLAGKPDQAVRTLDRLVRTGRSFLEKAGAWRLLCNISVTQGDMLGALNLGFEALGDTGYNITTNTFEADMTHWIEVVDEARKAMTHPDLLDLPDMNDDVLEAVLDILATMILPAQFYQQHLMHGIVAWMVERSLKCGIARESAYAFIWWGMMLVDRRYARYQEGFEYAKAGYDLVVSRNIGGLYAKACLFFGDIVNFYRQPLRTDRAYLDQAFKTGIENGDLIHACYACNHILTNMIIAGDPLDDVWNESERLLAFVQTAGDENIEAILTSQRRFVLAMQGKTAPAGTLNGDDFDEAAFEKRISGSQMILMIFWYYIWKMASRYLLGRYDEAFETLKIADEIEYSDRWNMEVTIYVFFRGLILAAKAGSLPDGPERRELLAGMSDCIGHLRHWSDSCPENFSGRLALVSAERSRLTGEIVEAGRLYDLAIHEARKQQFPHIEALACERMGGMLRAERLVFAAEAYESRAEQAYRSWGAEAKLRGFHIPEIHAIFGSPLAPTPAKPDLPPGSHSDRTALLQLAAMFSGAGRVIVFRVSGNTPLPAAAWQGAETAGNPLPEDGRFPESVVNYVLRTGERIVERDCPPKTFPSDPYWNVSNAKSFACIPIGFGDTLTGVAYFENAFAKDAFSIDRLLWPSILSSQALAFTENERLLAESNEDKERLSLAIQAANLAFWNWDIRTNALDVNERWSTMLGYDPDEIVPTFDWWSAQIHDDDRAKTISKVQEHLDGKSGQYENTYRMRSKAGGWTTVLAIGKVIERDAENKPVRMCGFNIDMTEQQVLSERVKQSEKLEALGRLAGGVAHDFNNLLQVVAACAEILLFRNPDPEELKILRDMKQAVERGSDLTKRLLLFSRNQPPQNVSIVLNDHLRNSLGLLGRLVTKRIAIETDLCPDPLIIGGDPGQIDLVLVNLIVNARDAMPDGGRLSIVLSAFRADAAFRAKYDWARDEWYARVTVRDTGIGMDDSTLARIYEPFFTTKPAGQGTGLGLPSVFGIVKQHDGGIVVETRPGHGTTFHVHFPLENQCCIPKR